MIRATRFCSLPCSFLLLLICLTCLGSQAGAGNNSQGFARLSWSADSLLSHQQVPAGPSFPLYVQMQGVSDIQGLGVWLKWLPGPDSAGTGYQINRDVLDASCGWMTSTPPTNYFGGDSSYTGTIEYPGDSATTCLKYMVVEPSTPTVPAAKFMLAGVYVRDSNGVIDTLAITGAAKLTGTLGDTLDARQRPPADDGSSRQEGLRISAAPNPTADRIAFRLYAQTGGTVSLTVYNVAGRRIWGTGEQPYGVGRAVFAWDLRSEQGTRVPPGIYFAHVRGSAVRRTLTFVVIR